MNLFAIMTDETDFCHYSINVPVFFKGNSIEEVFCQLNEKIEKAIQNIPIDINKSNKDELNNIMESKEIDFKNNNGDEIKIPLHNFLVYKDEKLVIDFDIMNAEDYLEKVSVNV